MKFSESMIAWKPNSDNVKVIPLQIAKRKDHERLLQKSEYPYSSGGVYTANRNISSQKAKTLVFIEAIHLIVRDKVEPGAVHKAFLAIDEYVDGLADDVEGVDR